MGRTAERARSVLYRDLSWGLSLLSPDYVGVPHCPLDRIVRDFFPAVVTDGVVGAAGELPVVADRARLVLGRVGLVHSGRDYVIRASGDEEQRRALVVRVVDPRVLMARREVCEDTVPQPSPRRGDVVALVHLCRFLLAERVGECVVELIGGERHGLVPVRRVV